MNFALQKTLELVIVIGLGLMLQRKISDKENLKGIKVLILSVALPATIFVALLKTKLDANLLIFPLMALGFNVLLFIATRYFMRIILPPGQDKRNRTLSMLLPSLAPGLSCFPFIMAYAGDDTLALAALADVGNKVFGLILLYMLAMKWYHHRSASEEHVSQKSKLKKLLLALVNEPINIVIVLAIVLLAFGLNIDALPSFLSNSVLKISAVMTPLVLLFIGMSAKIKWSDVQFITSILCWRAGITLMLSGLVILLIPSLSPALILFVLVFPQSSCSFWPFAHMSTVNSLEEKDGQSKPTFDIDFAISVLALSLPFSTVSVMTIFTLSDLFMNPVVVWCVGLALFSIPLVTKFIRRAQEGQQFSSKRHYQDLKL